jgi:hypothetical protein
MKPITGDVLIHPVTLVTVNVVRQFLRYSFIELDFNYNKLTVEEKSFCTKKQFDAMVKELRLT